MSLALALFGSCSSFISMSDTFAYLLSLFSYSFIASRQYFSFNLPTVIIVSFIISPHFNFIHRKGPSIPHLVPKLSTVFSSYTHLLVDNFYNVYIFVGSSL